MRESSEGSLQRGVKGRTIALALTWDGARWPVRTLPVKARAFLQDNANKLAVPTASEAAKLFANDEVRECRVCWVPRLKGGPEVLSEPFLSRDGKRLGFRADLSLVFGDVLGVIYRRDS